MSAIVGRVRRALRLRTPLSLRTHLLLVVLAAMVPLLVFFVVSVALIARDERATFQRGATERTLALVTAIDTELRRASAALEVLGASADLDAGDLAAFRVDAERVLARRPEWVTLNLRRPDGRPLLDLLRPTAVVVDGEPEPRLDRKSFETAVHSARPTIGALGSVGERPVFPVRVPVLRDGSVQYVLTARVRARAIDALLASQGLPADWVGVVLDANQTIVARTVDPGLVGRSASDSLRAALAESDSGWFQGATIEGWPVYAPFHRSAFSGWTVAMGIPTSAVDASLRRAVGYQLALGVAMLALAAGLAWVLSRRSARSIEGLTAMAGELGLGRRPAAARRRVAPMRIAEVEELEGAFSNAARLIQARSEERDRVEASLRQRDAELQESDRRKDQFLAVLGHELRNPLGVISIAVQMLGEKETADPAVAELRAMAERQVAHMTRLLGDLLDVSRIAQARVQVEKVLCDLVALARETVDDHRELVDRGGLKLEVELPDRPLWVMGDRTRLAQAIANLLSNACKFTDAGGVVTVRLAEEDAGAAARLTVRDTGVGMEPQILASAFEPFRQADRTVDRSGGGLGLGLALVKGLVELHGGTVGASSPGVGRGATLWFRLPLEPAVEPAASPERPVARSSRPLRILVVEDNRMAARSLEMALAGAGHAVETVHDGRAGIDAARRRAPDAVVCDVGLPGADGYEVVRALRADPSLRGVHLVALTGYGQQDDRTRAREAGFDVHLTKPVSLPELLRILAEGRRGQR